MAGLTKKGEVYNALFQINGSTKWKQGYTQVMTIPPNVRYQELFLEAEREAREN